jgi:hypothetical protein
MRGIYIKESAGDKVTGFYLSFQHGGWVVHGFTNCTLALVEENAARVIHDPETYYMDAP